MVYTPNGTDITASVQWEAHVVEHDVRSDASGGLMFFTFNIINGWRYEAWRYEDYGNRNPDDEMRVYIARVNRINGQDVREWARAPRLVSFHPLKWDTLCAIHQSGNDIEIGPAGHEIGTATRTTDAGYLVARGFALPGLGPLAGGREDIGDPAIVSEPQAPGDTGMTLADLRTELQNAASPSSLAIARIVATVLSQAGVLTHADLERDGALDHSDGLFDRVNQTVYYVLETTGLIPPQWPQPPKPALGAELPAGAAQAVPEQPTHEPDSGEATT